MVLLSKGIWKKASNLLCVVSVVFVTALFLFPFFWMFLNSFKRNVDITTYPPVWIFHPTLENFKTLFMEQDFVRFCLNSLLVALGATFLALASGTLAAYSIARFRQQRLSLLALSARIIPYISFLIPWFIFFSMLHLVDTHISLILTHTVITLPLSTWIMIGFFEDVPRELEDAGRIDGCSNITVFLRITLPLVTPGLVAASIFGFIFSWNNFMFALVLAGPNTKTVPLAVFHFISYGSLDWAGLNAAATAITLPALIFMLFIQKYLVKGLTMTGLKG